ncbi:MAG: hopanoid biosynthesis-associated protein HpnK [Janthinobacterium lividum]
MKRAILSADDFGLSPEVNEAVERAHRDGLLSTASLMVAGVAAADAVRRARRLPGLRVGLHLVVIEGPAVLPPARIPALVDAAGRFPSDQLRLGVDYFFRPAVRRQLAAEIEAQFAAFAATGLALDHANAHKHMHLHPTVGRLMIESGLRHGLRALRVPSEPPDVLAACGTRASPGDRALRRWSGVLRRQALRAGLRVNDHAFGLAWSGHMTAGRLCRLAPHLPDGLSEIYLHPATHQGPLLRALMPGYEPEAELAALLDPAVRRALAGVELTTYGP